MSNDPTIHLIHVPGMTGYTIKDARFVRTFNESDRIVAEGFDWPERWYMFLKNLRDRQQHGFAAEQLCDLVQSKRAAHPDDAIVLTGHSTGTLIILESLTQLPVGVVTQAWLLAAAVSPRFDLCDALAHTDRMVSVCSYGDLHLSVGTPIGGTADGRHQFGAGCVGFRGPGSDASNFEQWRYRPSWIKHGYLGEHITVLATRFARNVITPSILGFQSDRASDESGLERGSQASCPD